MITLMSAMFVRLSVFWQEHQLDVSLPAHRPIFDFLDDIVDLFRLRTNDPDFAAKADAEAHLWVLSSPEQGVFPVESSLSERGVVDGDRLYLSSRVEAAHEPFVDDVMSEMRNTVGQSQLAWSGEHRVDGLVGTVVAVGAAVGAVVSVDTLTQPDALFSPLALVFLALIALALALWCPREWVRWVGLAIPGVAAIVGGAFLRQAVAEGSILPAAAQAAWIAVVSLALIPAAWLAARTRHPNTADLPRATSIPAFVACGIIALVCAVCAVSVSFGASVYAFAAWGAWLPVALLLGTSTVAITSTGLSAMLRRNDDGAPIERTAIQARARRTEEVARGIAWAATACGALIIAVLSSGAYWQQGIIAAVLAVLLLLRTHGFSDARIIAPLLVVGVGGLGWVSASMVRWLAPGVQPTWAAVAGGIVLILACLLLIYLVRHEPDALAEARLTKFLNVIDTVASLAFIPLVLAGQGVFTYYWATT